MTQPIALHKATQDYLDYLQELGKHPRTLYTYSKDLEQIVAFFGPEKPLTSILNIHIGKFLKSDQLRRLPNGQERSPATINKAIRVLRMFFVWAHDTELIQRLPLPKDLPMGRSLNASQAD
jgi:site-specific recombinase XerD